MLRERRILAENDITRFGSGAVGWDHVRVRTEKRRFGMVVWTLVHRSTVFGMHDFFFFLARCHWIETDSSS